MLAVAKSEVGIKAWSQVKAVQETWQALKIQV